MINSDFEYIKMSIEELAFVEKAQGERIVKKNNFYWTASKGYFYRPLFLFGSPETITPSPPLKSLITGYQIPVSKKDANNSYINVMIDDDPHHYSLDKLVSASRKKVRYAIKSDLKVRRIEKYNDLLENGYKIYYEFYGRTGYKFRSDRTRKEIFKKWIDTFFNNSKVAILGLFHKDELSGISVSYLVEDVIYNATFFCNENALKLRGADLMLHTIRENASKCEDASILYSGNYLKKWGINEYKILRGFKIVPIRTHLYLNPLIKMILKSRYPQEYQFVRGYDENQIKKIYDKVGSRHCMRISPTALERVDV